MTRDLIIKIGIGYPNSNITHLAAHALKLHDENVILKLQIENLKIAVAKTDRQIKMLLDPCEACGVNPKHLRLAFCSDCYTIKKL